MGNWESTEPPAGWAGINGIPEAPHVPGTVVAWRRHAFGGRWEREGSPARVQINSPRDISALPRGWGSSVCVCVHPVIAL